MDLLLDGYISQTLTPLDTEQYVKLFIKCLEKEQHGTFVAFHDGWVVARSTTVRQQQQRRVTTRPIRGNRSRPRPSSPPPTATRALELQLDDNVDADADINTNTEYEIFDRKVNLYAGTIVPQQTWIGVSEKTGVLCPIFFIQRDGALGVPYGNPVPERSSLHNAMAPAPDLLKRTNQNMRIRIKVRPFPPFLCETRAKGGPRI